MLQPVRRDIVAQYFDDQGDEARAIAERHEMISPGHEFARRIDPALEEMEPGRPVEIVGHVVFARPQKLDRGAGLTRLRPSPSGYRRPAYGWTPGARSRIKPAALRMIL